MFSALTNSLNETLRKWRGHSALTAENVQETLEKVREALIQADVSFSVVESFIETMKAEAIGQKVDLGLKPGEFFIKLVYDQLVKVMGDSEVPLEFSKEQPSVILMAGLQGSGKTTTAAKLAKYLQDTQRKKVALVSCDVYRPAAILQLQRLAEELGVLFISSEASEKPETILKRALSTLKQHHRDIDVLIVDTAGRLHVDEKMMAEIQALHSFLNPAETLFVADSMTGQDATRAAERFSQALPLTGVILTKVDGDNQGGAALSIRQVTGKPIKFLGVGEKIEALELFYPDRMASRILGMGDVLSLVEELTQKVDKEKAEALAKKMKKGHGFDLEDLSNQIQQMMKMGGMGNLLEKMPGMGMIPQQAKDKVNDSKLLEVVIITKSMTPLERRKPLLINGSRKRRIARGAGVDIQAVNRVLKQHQQMEKMMKKMQQKGGMHKMMRMLQGKTDNIPGGMGGGMFG